MVNAEGQPSMSAPGGTAMSSPAYPPLDVPKPFADGVFLVDSLLDGVMGRLAGTRMTILRLRDGGLLLHSPTRFTPALHAAVQAIGPVRHLLAPNLAHWMFFKDWADACPDATTWSAPNLARRKQVRDAGVRFDREVPDHTPAEWAPDVTMRLVPGGLGFTETALFHRPSRTLVLTDLVLNLEPGKLPLLARPLAQLAGVTAPDGMPPPYLRAVVKLRRRRARAAARRLLDLQPERVVFAHGTPFEHDAAATLRRSFRWLLPD
jgi:hypothetical protein